MSMYEMVFGPSTMDRATVCAALLMNPSVDVDVSNLRLRDGWIEKQQDGTSLIVLYTRNGGGNRQCYCDDYADTEGFVRGTCIGCYGDAATQHPNYVRDADDEFDSTYRTYWFTVPDWLGEGIRAAIDEAARDHVDTDDRWRQAIDAIRTGI
jgi:hypothetical protein